MWRAIARNVRPAAVRSAQTSAPVLRRVNIPRIPNVRWVSNPSSATASVEAASAAAAKNRKIVGYWIMTTAGMVFVMVVLGGVTRLTRSGLSIVEWRPTGETLPSTDEEWQVEFEKYQAFPEYLRVNRHMTLDEFKPIYFMEWFHRFWGRAIGVAFAGPLAYFALSRRIPPGFWSRMGLLLGIGAAQGGVGWWMVKSGLEHERFDEHSIPRVSPYRLATHLGFAFTVYSMLVWTGLDLLSKPIQATAAQQAAVRGLRPYGYLATALIATTVASGAFVAGNDAGHAYNDWPLMAGKFIPEQFWEDKLGIKNIFENTATVQFDHRMLAYTTFFAVGGVHMASRKFGGMKMLPQAVRKNMIWLGALVGAQVLLGISTLMMYVPVPLAAGHQAGALALLTGAISLAHSMKRVVDANPAAQAPAKATAAVAALAAAFLLKPDEEEC